MSVGLDKAVLRKKTFLRVASTRHDGLLIVWPDNITWKPWSPCAASVQIQSKSQSIVQSTVQSRVQLLQQPGNRWNAGTLGTLGTVGMLGNSRSMGNIGRHRNMLNLLYISYSLLSQHLGTIYTKEQPSKVSAHWRPLILKSGDFQLIDSLKVFLSKIWTLFAHLWLALECS